MIHVNNKSPITIADSFLVFECKIDDYIPMDFIKDELNYTQIKDKSRNAFKDTVNRPELQSLLNSFSNENLYKILDELYESNKFWFGMSWAFNREKYPTMYDFVKDNLLMAKTIFMDTPGWDLVPHFDNRLTFGNLILNLDDNPISTKFHDYRNDNKIIYESLTEKGTGTLFLNHENGMHSYINSTTQNRYVMVVTMILKPGF